MERRLSLINPQILVEMIQCPTSGMTHAVLSQYSNDEYAFGVCVWCRRSVFSDLKAKRSLAAGPMAKFLDHNGHLWVANQNTYIIQEEPF